MPDLTLLDLVHNGTMSADMAAVLAAAAEERRSILCVAIPRMAGKSTVMRAALTYVPAGTPMHVVSRSAGRDFGIPAEGDGGYLALSEISPAGFDDYLWGYDAQYVFDALSRGFSLATALHAGSVDEAFEVITQHNGVPDEQAARIDLMVYIRSLGVWHRPSRRVVAALYEIGGVHDGRPEARLLQRWSEQDDRFEVVDAPQRIGTTANIDAYRAMFSA